MEELQTEPKKVYDWLKKQIGQSNLTDYQKNMCNGIILDAEKTYLDAIKNKIRNLSGIFSGAITSLAFYLNQESLSDIHWREVMAMEETALRAYIFSLEHTVFSHENLRVS